jgi:DNA-binding transcriptional LysR family regulator
MPSTIEDLPALALFARVVELRSFTAAAAASELTKAAVSQRIARLEQAALSSIGLLVTLSMTVADDLAAGRLVEVLADYESEPLGIYALVAEPRHAPPAARALVQHLARTFRPAGRGR